MKLHGWGWGLARKGVGAKKNATNDGGGNAREFLAHFFAGYFHKKDGNVLSVPVHITNRAIASAGELSTRETVLRSDIVQLFPGNGHEASAEVVRCFPGFL